MWLLGIKNKNTPILMLDLVLVVSYPIEVVAFLMHGTVTRELIFTEYLGFEN